MRSRVRRCARENSAAGGAESRVTSRAIRLSDGGSNSLDIAFSPPGEDEGPATPLFRFVVDPRPEGNEVVERGNQGKQNHEPDGGPCNPVHREKVSAEKRPLGPAASENHGHHGN